MKMDCRVVAFIPARGGSVSIPLKNIKPIAGKPLLHWVLEATLSCSFIDKIYISTDSEAIKACATSIDDKKIQIISRSPQTATDIATSESALLEFAAREDFDVVIMLQATSPLTTPQDLEAAWKIYQEGGYHSLLSVVRQRRFIWNIDNGLAIPVMYDPKQRPRRQDFAGYFVENGAFYFTSRTRLLESGTRISGRTGVFEMSDESYYELDEPTDWIIVESLLNKRKKSFIPESRLKRCKALVMDVDGVLTDAGMYYTDDGNEMKKFNTRDGKGLELIRDIGFKTAIITSEITEIVRHRAQKLKIDYLRQGARDKDIALQEIVKEMGLALSEVAYIGDDLNDIPAMNIAGLTFCPSDATEAVRKKADFVLVGRGGNGAVREVCELLLKSAQEGNND
jgi:N-acylneuraminate cytidylyltransferase